MKTMTFLIGLPGSGKSTYANKTNDKVFSSDDYRKILLHDENNQKHNNIIFNKLHNDIIEYLKSGDKNVIYDCTNLTIKNRKSLLTRIRQSKIKDINIVAKVFACPVDECISRQLNRKRKVSESVILQMASKFQFPLYNEGFNDIELVYTSDYKIDPVKKFAEMRNFNQNNHNHTQTLDNHCFNTCQYLMQYKSDANLLTAALFHDIGKVYTKTTDDNGESHYYRHSNRGAYEILFCNYTGNIDVKEVAKYINYHMIPFSLNNAKIQTVEKYMMLFSQTFYENLMLLNEADINSK